MSLGLVVLEQKSLTCTRTCTSTPQSDDIKIPGHFVNSDLNYLLLNLITFKYQITFHKFLLVTNIKQMKSTSNSMSEIQH